MALIRVSTALGRLAAIIEHRNPNTPSSLIGEMIDSPSATLRKLMVWYHSNLFNKEFNDCLERRRNDVVKKIGAELGVKIPSELGVEIPSELFPNLPESLDQKTFWDGRNSERKRLEEER